LDRSRGYPEEIATALNQSMQSNISERFPPLVNAVFLDQRNVVVFCGILA
jgi:hypothetical protein